MPSDSERTAAGDELESGVHTDFSSTMSYGDFLEIETLLSLQRSLRGSHDEVLFVIIHQATELWFKLMIHEVRGAMRSIAADDVQPALKMLARVSRVQEQITQSWSVLSTLTPADYLAFRDALGQASGFQSVQYRTLEFLLGDKQAAKLAPHRPRDPLTRELAETLHGPSLYDEVLKLLARRGFAIEARHLGRDLSEPYTWNASVEAAWMEVYRDTATHWELYELAEKLVDIEDAFQQWRFRHLKTVERLIGHKRGTGGSAGVPYLVAALDREFFPELWRLRTAL